MKDDRSENTFLNNIIEDSYGLKILTAREF